VGYQVRGLTGRPLGGFAPPNDARPDPKASACACFRRKVNGWLRAPHTGNRAVCHEWVEGRSKVAPTGEFGLDGAVS